MGSFLAAPAVHRHELDQGLVPKPRLHFQQIEIPPVKQPAAYSIYT
jgi:hypothetical protein